MGQAPSSLFRALQAGYAEPAVLEFFASLASEGIRDEERAIADRYVAAGDSILLVGGGGAREARAWALEGRRVTVADMTVEMVGLAARSTEVLGARRPRLVAANAVALPFRWSTFDHVLLSDSVYDGIRGRALRQRMLRDAAALVRGGFLFVQCGWIGASARVPPGDIFQKLRVVRQWLAGNFSAREAGDACIRRLVPTDLSQRQYFWHFFRSPEEIREELSGAGMSVEDRISGIWVLRPSR